MVDWARIILSLVGRNDHLIKQLSETPPIRRAAQIAAAMYHKSKGLGEDVQDRVKELGAPERMESFKKTFSDELKSGLEDLKQELKQKKDKP